jgi:hypothetical protein
MGGGKRRGLIGSGIRKSLRQARHPFRYTIGVNGVIDKDSQYCKAGAGIEGAGAVGDARKIVLLPQ